MPISKQKVKHIAELSKLQLSKEEVEKFKEELSAILDYIGKLDSVDTGDIEPLSHPSGITSTGREDVVDQDRELAQEDVLKNAPKKDDDYIEVKPVL
ncbi:MAG: Asp-tRNA(Asn)/Glu-tRNA(Gln) amidotransferase subunit GatC [Patescibacteria group bacterium]|nr:Asp-tRNA(Asn)/Glu-tRNA(Gln) amidotransferase subunit GatC [Patescibacteria group bacterium]